jgi:ComF family protein
MARLELPLETREEVSRVVPVPVSAARLRERGYNQAHLLARELARRHGWRDGDGLLERARSVASQTTLHRTERRANVAGAFRATAARTGELRREHVLLVDDVWTTGATALACADALIRGGARAVSVVTFARALPDATS